MCDDGGDARSDDPGARERHAPQGTHLILKSTDAAAILGGQGRERAVPAGEQVIGDGLGGDGDAGEPAEDAQGPFEVDPGVGLAEAPVRDATSEIYL